MTFREIKWHDLLAVRFVLGGTDCWWQAQEINARAGKKLPDLSKDRPTHGDSDAGLAALVSATEPYEVGDLLLSDPGGFGYPSHCSTVVEPGWIGGAGRPVAVAIGTTLRQGPYARPVRVMARELGVWRCR